MMKKLNVVVRLEELPPSECKHLGGQKILNVQFMYCTIPLWVFLYALGMPSDKEIVEMIDINLDVATSVNLLLSTISYADNKFDGFCKAGNALEIVKKSILNDRISNTKFPPKVSGFTLESAGDCLVQYLFPTLSRCKPKAFFLGHMVKCLLQSCSGQQKLENRDDFRNKRLDLAAELLHRELQNRIRHTERRMVKAIQRDLYGERTTQQIEHYIDASIITNGLSRAFSTGPWPHHNYVKYIGNVGDARFPHPSQLGKLCFLSTPDGEKCGLVKNLAVTGLVSTNSSEPLLDKLLECGMEKLTDGPTTMSLKGKEKIFLNGDWVGLCKDFLAFLQVLKSKRRSKEVPRQVMTTLGDLKIIPAKIYLKFSMNIL
ncbi:hypothetical protein IFM89_001884 [Coptis chinensis]|uniref:DNA-directed RNA polymerase n=1 Tax=Coptis chinensis TaxID=261450 RepID=A0A835IL02_9MAGN|nr:hypothetical protein IFM89_001884 [Coptis chinensis]